MLEESYPPSLFAFLELIHSLHLSSGSMINLEWDTQIMRNGVEARYTKSAIRNQLMDVYADVFSSEYPLKEN